MTSLKPQAVLTPDAVAACAKIMDQAVECDGWGQCVEAMDHYNLIADRLRAGLSAGATDSPSARHAHSVENQLYSCLVNRIRILSRSEALIGMPADSGSQNDSLTLSASCDGAVAGHLSIDDMRVLARHFSDIFLPGAPFPVDQSRFSMVVIPSAISGEEVLSLRDTAAAVGLEQPETLRESLQQLSLRGRTRQQFPLLAMPTRMAAEDVFCRLVVQRWGLKDAGTLQQCFVTMVVTDAKGNRIEDPQDSCHSERKPGDPARHEMFGAEAATFVVQTPVNKLSPKAHIFLELKHWKPKKKKVSVKCWSLLTVPELVEGDVSLEVYQKPTDWHAKTFHKHSVKDLYLHLSISLVKA